MRVDVVTIFPDYLAPLELSLIGRARADGVLDVRVHDLRRWAGDAHRTVDDTPYGGGPGMVMRPDIWGAALDTLVPAGVAYPPTLIIPTPSGATFSQHRATSLSQLPWLVVACGRYEGIDGRVVAAAAERMPVLEVSLGDYVLGGGEVAALVLIEAVARLLPGVLGNADSLREESHTDGLLEGPVFTKPPSWRGHDVPDVLRSGDHAAVARWRRDEALRRTSARRPDLIERLDPASTDRRDREVLEACGWVAAERFQRAPGQH